MDLSTYQNLAARTIKREFSPDELKVHAAFGLCSEAGEVGSHYQHGLQDGKPIDTAELKKEIGDCLWFIAELATAWNFDLGEIGEENIAKLKKRFPEGFDEERSIHRHEYDQE